MSSPCNSDQVVVVTHARSAPSWVTSLWIDIYIYDNGQVHRVRGGGDDGDGDGDGGDGDGDSDICPWYNFENY